MKKTRNAALIMALAMALTVASCDSKKNTSSYENAAQENTTEATTDTTTDDSTETASDETSEEELSENMLGTTADINDYIKTTDINPPLWKVTDPESGNSLYLLGRSSVSFNELIRIRLLRYFLCRTF